MLGVLKTVEPREVWKNEERDFTPWLAENINHISDTIGFPIEIEETEKRVGNYELDIFGKIEGTDKTVVIENQLESSDHRHLGQLITYASGLDASIIVWVTPYVNDEHRKAIDWLNEISNDDKYFFMIRPEVIRVDDSKPAVRFQLEASPSDFERTLKSIVSGKNDPRHQFRRVFWQGLLDYLKDNNHKWAMNRRTTSDSWMTFSIGRSYEYIVPSMAMNSKLRVEISLSSSNKDINKEKFNKLYDNKDKIDSLFKEEVHWEKLDNKKMSRVAVYLPYDKQKVQEDESYAINLYIWIEKNLLKMKDIIEEYL